MGAGCYCALCGTSITTCCTGYHQTARGLLHREARWSKVGDESNYGGLDPIGDDTQGIAETQPNFDPDLAATDEDWYRMTNAVQKHASFFYEGRITRGTADIPLKQLAFLLSAGVAWNDGSACWTEALAGCPDDAGIQAAQQKFPEMTRAQGNLKWVRRGAYEVSVARVPPPQLQGEAETQSSGTAGAAAAEGRPATAVCRDVVHAIPASSTSRRRRCGAAAWPPTRFSCSRRRGRGTATSARAGGGRSSGATTTLVACRFVRWGRRWQSMRKKGVDWKRLYYCYESRSARGIWRILRFLAERGPSASDALLR
ncbi:hypothetical protein DFJ73DRAFT_830129 [Zopfochytrium polystomum]|nr:hypothetical protein DFJ73DRAFT_830129 [Zopfochytrium polystomum]